MKDILLFKKMITPAIIQIVFWIGTAYFLILGLYDMFRISFVHGILEFIFGPVAVRILCEVYIIFFKIYHAVETIKEKK